MCVIHSMASIPTDGKIQLNTFEVSVSECAISHNTYVTKCAKTCHICSENSISLCL